MNFFIDSVETFPGICLIVEMTVLPVYHSVFPSITVNRSVSEKVKMLYGNNENQDYFI